MTEQLDRLVGRDPRIDPQPGDVICQYSGHLVRVTARGGDCVAWVERSPKGKEWQYPNRWTIRGWEHVVCDKATVVTVADA